ncbi:WG repeat-containing protein [Mucilaginibacter sp. KACC 22773]|uniref:WG repeat-containing protein n=1 Tax=Mucilaginibacter sp. KACC 22773 TaxID=3025671 RepID=UPI002365FF7B|nr:WG repeat-containing protein [Mucilaginibacter sp. KACC 22773]WDF77409.1 WG repeat-containing protein [Mucilaginibacter sp. KACC 22773]
MKTKPILIIIAIVVLLICSFLFIRGKYLSKPEKGEITQFLNAFNAQIKAGNIDSASAYFEDNQKSKLVRVLLSVLTNKTNTGGKEKPIFTVSLNTEDALIKLTNPEFATATIAATFKNANLPEEKSTLTFTIHKMDDKNYKITQVNALGFVKDYVTYQAKVYNKITPEKDIYSAITLAAFKTAEKLKTKYDSVIWFDHVNSKTFYYVIKGKLPNGLLYDSDRKSEDADYKMGLVDPGLKEIIPAEYDLIHNISGTIDGLIEVEKDDKKGFYNLYGKLTVPAIYDEVYPLKTGENLAVLKNGEDYFYLKADTTLSDKIADFKIADIVPQIKTFGDSYTLSDKSSKNVMEYNSRDYNTSLVISPSYLADLQILPKVIDFPNPLRKGPANSDEEEGGSRSIDIAFDTDKKGDDDNWLQSAYYTIVNDYLGGRGGLYTSKNVLVVDKKHNRISGFSAGIDLGEGEGYASLSKTCNESSTKAINDSLFEFKTTSNLEQSLLGGNEAIVEGPYYYYLQLKSGKLVALKSSRLFPTQFIKLDDSYLHGCYTIRVGPYGESSKETTIDHVNKSMLQYMKNEIFASYKYRFKNPKWNDVFEYRFQSADTTKNANVDDSLTVIDKYNIAFINNKLNEKPLNIKKINALTAR